MTSPTEALVALLDLEAIGGSTFVGRNRDLGAGRIYGGQVLAQALVAARRTIPQADREAHSLHAYFILEGDLAEPVTYFVDILRDGRSFVTRNVSALQHGRTIFTLSASFHRTESGLAHQLPMPDVPPPEELRPDLEVLREEAHRIPQRLRPVLTQDRPVDFRSVLEYRPFDPRPVPPVQRMWVRTMGALGDAAVQHQAALAYASDYGVLATALRPHGRHVRDPGLMVASLDHSIWFHRPFRADEWLLYSMDSPVTHGGRGFARGTFFTRDGTLVASVAQEGLLRTGIKPRRKRQPRAGDAR
ncbi:MAG: acyl-CoA thioesterase II [Gemmatimonadota bacterium]|nr:acyl-CoA thioesterase II [Gemmatimonadota bacterium]MDE2864552.1 acyl-CoA thioesterase II [Gemmatimonadota bacterium]